MCCPASIQLRGSGPVLLWKASLQRWLGWTRYLDLSKFIYLPGLIENGCAKEDSTTPCLVLARCQPIRPWLRVQVYCLSLISVLPCSLAFFASVSEHLDTFEQSVNSRFGVLETTLNGHTAILAQILARLPEKS